MEKKIIGILKKEDRLMSVSEIVIELKKVVDITINEDEIKILLQKLSDKNIISVVSTMDGDKYCFVEKVEISPITKTTEPLDPEIKKINTKIGIISGLIVVVFIGFILFVYGLSLAGGWDGYGDFTLGGIGMLVFFGANIVLGFLAGPFGKITKGFNDWTDYNSPGVDASCGDSIGGCGNVGCGYIVYGPICLAFGLIGFVFGIIAIKKLIEKKNNLK